MGSSKKSTGGLLAVQKTNAGDQTAIATAGLDNIYNDSFAFGLTHGDPFAPNMPLKEKTKVNLDLDHAFGGGGGGSITLGNLQKELEEALKQQVDEKALADQQELVSDMAENTVKLRVSQDGNNLKYEYVTAAPNGFDVKTETVPMAVEPAQGLALRMARTRKAEKEQGRQVVIEIADDLPAPIKEALQLPVKDIRVEVKDGKIRIYEEDLT